MSKLIPSLFPMFLCMSRAELSRSHGLQPYGVGAMGFGAPGVCFEHAQPTWKPTLRATRVSKLCSDCFGGTLGPLVENTYKRNGLIWLGG